MSNYDTATYGADELYALLPAFIRLRDHTEGGSVLQAIISVIAAQAQVVSAGLDQMYDDLFIETCDPWVVPYIGDLIGYRPLRALGTATTSRAEVADTIGYRRRKGTLGMLEQLAVDVTGWPAVAVEYFERLATTQYVRNHLRPTNAMVEVRDPMTALDIGGAFDAAPRSADVRRIASGRGRYNIANIGVFVWRLKPYPTNPTTDPSLSPPAGTAGPHRYTFDPFGRDVPLVNPPPPATSPGAATFSLVARPSLPFPLLRYPLYATPTHLPVEPYAQEINHRSPPDAATPMSPFGINVGAVRQSWSSIEICDLETWTPPTDPGIVVSVDPERGRLVFATPPTEPVTVDYTYAFSGDYGGGTYARPLSSDESTIESGLPQNPAIMVAQSQQLATIGQGFVSITDSGIYTLGDVALSPQARGQIVVAGADFQRPIWSAGVGIMAADNASITVRGLGIGAKVAVSGTGPLNLQLVHCTILGGVDWPTGVAGNLTVDHCLCGPLTVNADVDVTVTDSLIDAGSDTTAALASTGGASAGSVSASRCTVIGTVAARDIALLEDSIVTGTITSQQRQVGCVRYSYLPVASETPRRFRCQPDLAIDQAVGAAESQNPGLTPAAINQITQSIEASLLPMFTSRVPGQPGYGQLADATPDEIRYGAEEGNEMGVFFALYGAIRESNLSFRLNEYLRIGLEVGVIHAT